ncbi:MAG: cobyric acid synthase CobQ [Chloroflexi bacterium RBG_13_48_10]|nr:MAG: cobyric acid synthase CobQ [Chloroflexi bacterium RBG_13_48_10]
MVQGTTSDAGKSIIATALCRIFSDKGFTIAPFKSQNMSLNSGVTEDGREIARSQIVQAMAARAKPIAEHNPVLLKPKEKNASQIMLLGRPFTDYNYEDYYPKCVPQLIPHVKNTLNFLRENNDIVVIEGAGSPAEINLMHREIANMFVAKLHNSPVILVADIDRGGVFASIYGTIKLLPPEEQSLVKGFIINKFRGNLDILKPGIAQIEELVGKKCLGVVPYIPNLRIPAEDSQNLQKSNSQGIIDIKIIRLPQMANFTDFEPLAWEPTLKVTYIEAPAELGTPDVIIIPGTKNTVKDFQWFEEMGFVDWIKKLHQTGTLIVGICGGYQFLGEEIIDSGVEGGAPVTVSTLGLLPLGTEFKSYNKITKQVTTEVVGLPDFNGVKVDGYEIHMGRVWPKSQAKLFLRESERALDSEEGIISTVSEDGSILGTFLHGFWDNDAFRHKFIEYLFKRKKIPLSSELKLISYAGSIEKGIQEIAQAVKNHVDVGYIANLLEL